MDASTIQKHHKIGAKRYYPNSRLLLTKEICTQIQVSSLFTLSSSSFNKVDSRVKRCFLLKDYIFIQNAAARDGPISSKSIR